ncbi:MAG: four helix bundle protein [Actinomycetota bacterium]|nr:four helix bundle protein [Actinomycetota bacterium]
MASYEDLIAYREANVLADSLRAAVVDWPTIDRWTLGVQVIRSADSVGANIAEAYGRGTPADQGRLFLIARGSAYETQHWIERAFARSLLSDDVYRARAGAVGQLVNGLLRSSRRRIRGTRNK